MLLKLALNSTYFPLGYILTENQDSKNILGEIDDWVCLWPLMKVCMLF